MINRHGGIFQKFQLNISKNLADLQESIILLIIVITQHGCKTIPKYNNKVNMNTYIKLII